MNVLFLGQKPLGEKCFDYLLGLKSHYYSIKVAVSNANSNSVWWNSNGIFKSAIKNKIEFFDNKKKNDELIIDIIEKYEISMIISIQHSFILSDDVLSKVNYNAFNLHMAKLPDYKGYYSFNHALLNKDKEYSVTLHQMKAEVDAGDIVLAKSFEIKSNDTAYSLYSKATELSFELFKCFLQDYQKSKINYKKMDSRGTFYSRSSIESHKEIKNWDEIELKSRAFYFPPFNGAYLIQNGIKIFVSPEVT